VLIGLGVLVVLLLAAAAWLYTPDKDRAALEAQYAGPPSVFLDVAGLRLHLRDTGPRDAPALVMLHGFGSSLHTWEGWAQALEGRYRVVRFDLPSFGLTGPDPTGDYSDDRTFAILGALLDRLGLAHATLVGNSMGGGIAWRFAAAHPDRVERLVLISPEGFRPPDEPPPDETPPDARPRGIPFTLRMMRYVLPTPLLRSYTAASYADPARLTPAVMARYRDMLLVPGNRDAILGRMGQMRRPDPGPLLARLHMPVLLIWGEQDRLIPFSNAADYMRALPDATLAALPGLGHVPQEEAPEVSLPPLRRFLP
jgi:pimeloyl-ACP methyl ester carboxylesterase